ncbi:hypothetical protein [Algibacter sp. L1A34]|uniref:hypothetical protein n=1 Tax=Algibacter sp. L1A34 TaxID=2686365 RepID=UPI00131C0BA1|nr:hypothetical protein [Algibacter sp. L1A34]
MKTFNPFLIIPLLLCTFLFSCGQLKGEKSMENSKSRDVLLQNHLISSAQGKEMFAEFNENRTKIIEGTLQEKYKDNDFEDTKFIWYSLDEIKAYLQYIESIQKANPKQDVSGLRIYFAAYPNSKKFKSGKSIKHPKQQTVFMIPTVGVDLGEKKHKSMNHLPFIIKSDSSNPLAGQFEIVDELMIDFNKKKRLEMYYKKAQNFQKAGVNFSASLFTARAVETSTIYNEGEMIPPPYKLD